ncbi:MAG: hypothetical protein Q7S40_21205 [Opitutaceae bacterium]|nr:hypothetical protein [Opitutaceae bacterium]
MNKTDRRTFLRTTLGAAAGAFCATPGCVQPNRTMSVGQPRPCAPAAWRKHGVVLEATEDGEGTGIQSFTSPAEPLPGGRWRIWYTATGSQSRGIAFAEGVPGGPMRKFVAQCSAGDAPDAPFGLGNLPDGWRPKQVVHVPLRNGTHRIYFWAHGPEILRYLAADSDDGRRYRVVDPLRPVLYHPNDRAAQGVASPDGVMLRKQKSKARPVEEPLAVARLISNDASNIYQQADGTFELYSVGLVPVPRGDPAYIAHDNAPGLLRVIDRYTSADGLNFETRARIIQRDAQDPVDQQFYYLSVTRTPQGCVGMLGHYRCEAQTMDLEWCFSPDGTEWQRPLRQAWLPRGLPSEVDSYGIYANSRLVHHDGLWHLFYTGVNRSHNGKQSHGKPKQAILYATTPSIWA